MEHYDFRLAKQIGSTPIPINLSYFWNFGSLLGSCLRLQILTGVFLAIHYQNRTSLAFERVSHIIRDVNLGWLLRMLHANGASLFFICLYIHIARGIFYTSYFFIATWVVGVIILLLTQATAFLGYVLPWGQISFWGATVITNLVSSIPYIGEDIVYWLWGGFSVREPTLTRFFTFHFLVPFILIGLVGAHILFLHGHGSGNPLGLPLNYAKVRFHPYFSLKDLVGGIICLGGLVLWVLIFPWALGDPENFIPANPSVTPQHIQPEWYFLFAYAILRAIPNKLGGVVALIISILIFLVLPYTYSAKFRGITFYPLTQRYYWIFVINVLLLTWIGARPVKEPYIMTGQILRISYFLFFLLFPWSIRIQDKLH